MPPPHSLHIDSCWFCRQRRFFSVYSLPVLFGNAIPYSYLLVTYRWLPVQHMPTAWRYRHMLLFSVLPVAVAATPYAFPGVMNRLLITAAVTSTLPLATRRRLDKAVATVTGLLWAGDMTPFSPTPPPHGLRAGYCSTPDRATLPPVYISTISAALSVCHQTTTCCQLLSAFYSWTYSFNATLTNVDGAPGVRFGGTWRHDVRW